MNKPLELLQQWVDAGWLRHLDRALARWVAELDPQARPELLMATALLAHLEGRGHTCLPLEALVREPAALLAWPAPAPQALAQAWHALPQGLDDWLEALRRSPVVHEEGVAPDQGQPLVLGGSPEDPLLYLRRYWGYETRVAQALRERASAPLPVDEALARQWLARLFAPAQPGQVPDAPARNEGDAEVDWQQLACAVALRSRVAVLTGGPGTGKTYTAFQIIWRLLKSGAKKRILFLADRNILIDQTMVNDFRPFKGAMAKLSPHAKGVERVDAQGQVTVEDVDLAVNKTTKVVDKSYEIYLSLYQAVTGTQEERNIYKQFSPDFFDLIVVDECHRGSAAEDSAWRDILTYFASATQIGLTATPKETEDVSNIDYFGEPLYTYSLKQGIEDGYLAPYKVVRVDLDKDTFGWRPTAGMLDKHGNLIEDRIYTGADMNRKLVMEQRDAVVAAKVTEYLKATDRYAKTIVFCEDIEHAERMRKALSNANADLRATQPKYVVQITGDNTEGKRELDNFIDPEKTYPVIAVTSKLMSTGVDAQTCKLIVLDQTIKSMTLFKQIIGRGTRLREDLGKTWFTILDFKRATELFADKDFDGEPVQIYEPGNGQPVAPPEPAMPGDIPGDAGTPGGASNPLNPLDPLNPLGPFAGGGGAGAGPKKYVLGNNVTVSVARERVQYLNAQGKLITESLRDYTRINLLKKYDSLDQFLQAWQQADRKAALLQELEAQGVLLDALADEVGKDLDPFDLLLHVAYDQPPLTRSERARRVKKRNVFTQYGPVARKVLEALLDKYADEGITTIESNEVFKLQPFTDLGSPVELVRSFGGRPQYLSALQALEQALYATHPAHS